VSDTSDTTDMSVVPDTSPVANPKHRACFGAAGDLYLDEVFASPSTACAAARRAVGTRNGEQDT
jgi:hypothetical protein